MAEPLVTVQIVVKDGERFIRRCLDAVRAQTYRNLEVVVLDNASTDATRDIVAAHRECRLVAHPKNLGMWPGHELLLPTTRGTYVLCLSADVILHPSFVAEAVAACEADLGIAAVQGKFYQYETKKLENGSWELPTAVIDTCGFALTRARKVVNIGHGMADGPAYAAARDIFGVEGAAPFYRRTALENCRVNGHLWDPDYFWYGDDFDFAWRMTLLGHRQRYVPSAIAWHDRATTKGAAATPVLGQLRRLESRRAVPLFKRRMDWANVRFSIIKNDPILNLLTDLPRILVREAAVLAYTVLLEPRVLTAAGRFLRLAPRMLARRRAVQARAVLTADQMRRFFA